MIEFSENKVLRECQQNHLKWQYCCHA